MCSLSWPPPMALFRRRNSARSVPSPRVCTAAQGFHQCQSEDSRRTTRRVDQCPICEPRCHLNLCSSNSAPIDLSCAMSSRGSVCLLDRGGMRRFPTALDARLKEVLRARGIDQLYTHQADAIDGVLRGEQRRRGDFDRFRQDAVLQPAGTQHPAARFRKRPRSISSRRRRWRTINSPR